MKTKKADRTALCRAVLACGLSLSQWLWVSAEDSPTISAIRTDPGAVAVVVQVPAGIKKVTLECRARLGAGAWVPRALARLDGTGGELVFRLPNTERMEVLRVRADAREPLPTFFYQGTNSFPGQITYLEGAPGAGWGGNLRFGDVDLVTGPGVVPVAGEPAPSSREVVEADIWKLSGDTLFFFNQYRGLQVIDIREPDAARVRGSLSLPAAGEDLYLLGEEHVVLLVHDACGQWWDGEAENRILIVNVELDPPRIVASLPVKGQIRESRLVGTALYVAADTYQAVAPDTREFGTLVSAFDLAQPAVPVARPPLWFAGSEHTIAATDVFLLVATGTTENYWRSELHGIDITAPDGTLREYASIRTAGRIADKFKLNWADGVLATVSEMAPMNGSSTWLTRLETFSFPHPASVGPLGVVKLGEVELGHGERLFATRFDGSKVYVVTYRQVDPLWVVDLSDPARPRIAGELQVPGWSTYLHPLGNRLLTMGIDDVNGRRASVSLFDVHDAAVPRLLSRVSLGDNYSWSEANQNEKAFKVLTDQGLILVPFEGAGGPQVQLIDLHPDSLEARGAINHSFQPRRATHHRDRVLSLSGLELLSVDVADRDHPQVKAEIELAWAVDQVFVQGDYLIQLTFGSVWDYSAEATLRVAPADAPDTVLTQLVLTNRLPISGAAIKDGRLYVVQQRQDYWWWIVPLSPTPDSPADTNPPSLVLSVIDLQALPELEVVGEATGESSQAFGGNSTRLLWPKPGLLVLADSGAGYSRPWYGYDLWLPAMPAYRWYWGWGGNSGRLTAFAVQDPTGPRLLSTADLKGTNQWWNFGEAFAAGGGVFLSHQGGEPTVVGTNYYRVPETTYLTSTNIQTITNVTWLTPDKAVTNIVTVTNVVQIPQTTNVTREVPMLRWDLRAYLDVVDYADPQEPTVRPPVNLPGTLRGLSHDGALLYTVGYHWKGETNRLPEGGEWLDASAYDRVEVHLVDSLEMPQTWPQPLLVNGTDIFLGRASATNASESLLETWSLSDAGKFTRRSGIKLPAAAEQLAVFGNLVAVQTGGTLELFDLADSASPKPIGSGQAPHCLGMHLPSADGSVDRGLSVPLSSYGVWSVPVWQGP